MFVSRIWFDEVERIGKQKCTPMGYVIHVIGDYVGVAGVFMLPAVLIYLGYRSVAGSFHASLLWLLAVPFALGIAGWIIVGVSWGLATRKQFRYDYERRESTWIEQGEQRSYTIAEWQSANARRES